MRAQSRNHSCRIHDNFKIGKLDAVVLENEKLRITVAAGRGADVVEFLHKPDDLDLVWLTAKGLADGEVNYNYQDPLGTFIDEYPGGWQTIFPNGGATSNYQGADFGQHAEMALLPWDFKILKDTPEGTFNICADEHPVRGVFYPLRARQVGVKEANFIWGNEPERYVSNEKIKKKTGYTFVYPDPLLFPSSN